MASRGWGLVNGQNLCWTDGAAASVALVGGAEVIEILPQGLQEPTPDESAYFAGRASVRPQIPDRSEVTAIDFGNGIALLATSPPMHLIRTIQLTYRGRFCDPGLVRTLVSA